MRHRDSFVDLVYRGPSPSGKTKVFELSCQGQHLGVTKWYAPWRRFCFFPAGGVLFDAGCMQEIAAICIRETDAQKERQQKRRAAHAEPVAEPRPAVDEP